MVLPVGKKAREAESLSSQRLCDAQNLTGKPKPGRSVGLRKNWQERPRPSKTVSHAQYVLLCVIHRLESKE